MTFRARPTTKPTTRRRTSHESDARRNLYFNLGFGLIVAVAVLLLVGAGAATWIGEHLAPVAKVNGVSITKDQLRSGSRSRRSGSTTPSRAPARA